MTKRIVLLSLCLGLFAVSTYNVYKSYQFRSEAWTVKVGRPSCA